MESVHIPATPDSYYIRMHVNGKGDVHELVIVDIIGYKIEWELSRAGGELITPYGVLDRWDHDNCYMPHHGWVFSRTTRSLALERISYVSLKQYYPNMSSYSWSVLDEFMTKQFGREVYKR